MKFIFILADNKILQEPVGVVDKRNRFNLIYFKGTLHVWPGKNILIAIIE